MWLNSLQNHRPPLRELAQTHLQQWVQQAGEEEVHTTARRAKGWEPLLKRRPLTIDDYLQEIKSQEQLRQEEQYKQRKQRQVQRQQLRQQRVHEHQRAQAIYQVQRQEQQQQEQEREEEEEEE